MHAQLNIYPDRQHNILGNIVTYAVLVPTINLECFKLDSSRSRVVTKRIGVLYGYPLLKSTEASFKNYLQI